MRPFRSVAAYAPPGATGLALGIVNEIFGRPAFDFALCTDRPGPLRTDLGLPLQVEHGLDRLAGADLVLALPGTDFRTEPPAGAIAALRAAYDRGAVVAAHCVGVYALAATGLLDGLDATTHWRFAADLAARRPQVRVRPEALYVDQGRVVTGAGAAAGIDLCLYLIRRGHGTSAANDIARDLVSPPHRDGGQLQYLAAPVPADTDDERLADVLAWARAHLDHRITVAGLAERALLSPRTFARRFKAATGATPHAWLTAQRLALAEELLETTGLPIEEIARRVGYGSAAVFREQFALRRGVAPRTYRRAFTGRS
ncbi:helix-turn-helix domain-containing protein [Streptomyces sp. NPDC002054]|uniref:GlxA family transcriptional regulator n=1 Tax=Streptomyces sp. NPDC002054 TaxID=3154663 RepID=UPI00332B1B11